MPVRGLVSIIIPVFNRPKMLVDSVNSALAQLYRPIEVIIIDDGSTDNTLSVAQTLADDHPEIKAFKIINSGPGLAREYGRQKAKGEFIQYLDSDDLLSPNKLTLQVNRLNAKPECGVSYCIQEYCCIDGTVIKPKWMRTGEHFETMFPAMLGARIWGTPVPLYRAKVLNQAGPWLNLKNQEDWEYDCRIASLGITLDYIDQTLVTIRTHNKQHFGLIGDADEAKLIDQAKAYQLIYQHAVNAEVDVNDPEFQRFGRAVFLVARQCAEQNLVSSAKSLMKIACICSNTSKRTIECRVYIFMSQLIGWSTMGKLSAKLDKLRA